MTIYRTNAKPNAIARWGASGWRKWYVRIARVFVDLRSKYAYQREYNQYLRDLDWWKRKYADGGTVTGKSMLIAAGDGNPLPQQPNPKRPPPIPPMPVPPPVRIME